MFVFSPGVPRRWPGIVHVGLALLYCRPTSSHCLFGVLHFGPRLLHFFGRGCNLVWGFAFWSGVCIVARRRCILVRDFAFWSGIVACSPGAIAFWSGILHFGPVCLYCRPASVAAYGGPAA